MSDINEYTFDEETNKHYKKLQEENSLLDYEKWAKYYLSRGEVYGIVREDAGANKES